MSSLLDQFNSQSMQSQSDPYPVMADSVRNSGYISMQDDARKTPIFKKHKMNISFPHNIVQMEICNSNLVLIMSNNVVFRMNLNDVDRFDEIPLDQYIAGLRIENMFLDPTGAHLLISLTPKSTQFCPELIYLHKSQKRPKKMEKFRDHEITAVAFNFENNSEASTGPILLGTSKGLIFEAEFAVEADKPVQNNWRQVFDIGRIKRIAITGLEFLRVPGSNKYVVLACTPERLYKFQETVRPEERSPFQAVFRAYTMESTDYLESSSVKFRASSAPTQLSRLCYDHANKFCRSFAVLTATDILCSEMDPWAETLANIVETRQVPFPECDTDDGQKSRLISPIAFALTDFHALLVYADHLVAISLLDYSVVYEEHFGDHRFGSLLNVARDEKTGNVYVYSTKAIFRMKVTDERRNVWKIYMDLGNMEYALMYAGDHPQHKDLVLSRTAERKFNSGLYVEAAAFYAETMTNFETVCLKFLELREMDALRVFLRKKLFGLHADEKTQITMLIVWLVELYLTEMARKGQRKDESASGGLQKEFDDFMATPRVAEWTKKNPKVLYQLLASHGDCNNLLVSTMATAAGNDFEEAVNQLVQQQQWQEALKVMRAQRRPDLFYRFGPILMEAMPKETVAALKEQREMLEPSRLLPTLVCVDSATHVREVVQYLEFSIHSLGTTERAVHNYLIRLFAEHFKDRLKPYLETQGKDVSQLHYDRQYALRVCKQWQCNEACVFLQCLLGLWTDAVELALTFDVKLAQETANLPAELELRRKLWLRIAKHEVEDRQADEVNVERALQLLRSCDLLRIEDILPLFADFEKIDHLKEAICEALQEYNLRIQEQKKDMEEAAKAAERVRKDLQTFRERALTIEVNDLCGSCAEYVLKRPCFVFPCGHKFHADCLERDWLQQSREGGRLSILKQRMVTAEGTSEFTKHRAAYEDLLAGECLFCGQLMIEAIDQPLVEDWDRVTSDWE